MSELGIKETKEVLVGLNEVGLVLASRFKDGVGVDDFVAFYDKLRNDVEFKSKLEAAYTEAGKVPSEIGDISVGEGIELALVQVSYVPKYVEALSK